MRSSPQAQPGGGGLRPGPSRARGARRDGPRRDGARRAPRRGGRVIGAAKGCLFVLACWAVDSVGASCASVAFSERQVTNSADGAYSVFAIDVDGDGDVDALSASAGDDTVAWYENDGSQSFTERIISNSANGARSVFAIDVDGDGDSFAERVITNSADNAFSVFAIDVDGDGDVDVLSASAYDDTVAWYENDGSQSFTERIISNSADAAVSVFAIDVDGDGNVDALSAAGGDDTVAWYENDGSQSFTECVITNSADNAFSVFAIDVDGDGDVDALSVSRSDDTVAWYENDGAESFTERIITNSADYAYSVFAIDVDGDGDVDVLSASYLDDTVAWYENDGSLSFTERVITNAADGATSVFAIDVDGDGDVDALSASTSDDTVAWYENECGSPSATPSAAPSSGTSASPSSTPTASFLRITSIGIGATCVSGVECDLLWVYRGDPGACATVDVEVSDSDGTVVRAETATNDGQQTQTVAGDAEVSTYTLTLACSDDATLADSAEFEVSFTPAPTIAPSRSPSSFTERTISDSVDGRSIYAIDIDSDGDVDALSASRDDDTIAWYENDGDQSFTQHLLSTLADGALCLYAIDIDGDGDVDVLSASHADDTVAWYENDGSQSFTERIIHTAAATATSVFAIDVDGDGDVDALSASAEDDTVAWYENDCGTLTPTPVSPSPSSAPSSSPSSSPSAAPSSGPSAAPSSAPSSSPSSSPSPAPSSAPSAAPFSAPSPSPSSNPSSSTPSAAPSSTPSASPPSSTPTASFLRITSIGIGATCVSGVECDLLWVYRGDPGACATVDVEVSDSTGPSSAETATNDGQQTQTVAGDAEVSTYTLTLACSDDATLADSAEFEVSFTPADGSPTSSRRPREGDRLRRLRRGVVPAERFGRRLRPRAAGVLRASAGARSASLCFAGYVSSSPGATSCESCAAGRYSAAAGSSKCENCTAGRYSSLDASIGCSACPAGRFAAGTGAEICEPCPDGTDSPEAAAECDALTAAPSTYYFEGTLRAYYSFDEGNATDATGAYSGDTYKNGMARNLGPTESRDGGDASAGGEVYVLPEALTYEALTGDEERTICLWARIDDWDGGFLFEYGSGRRSTVVTIYGNTSYIDWDDWHHYCLTYDGTDLVLYLRPRRGDRPASLDTETMYGLRVGADVYESNKLTGAIDELYVYTSALDREAISVLYGSVTASPTLPDALTSGDLTGDEERTICLWARIDDWDGGFLFEYGATRPTERRSGSPLETLKAT
ncbi:hypothetical protein JL720_15409 [Aureococcus anophagefferens]|nr:hypothetical protein JL720_15409 [Aureococcus anophagefferens]